jgi:hypothetical protein
MRGLVGYPTSSFKFTISKINVCWSFITKIQSNLQILRKSEEDEEEVPWEVLDALDPRKSGRASLYLFAKCEKTASKFRRKLAQITFRTTCKRLLV